MSAAPGFSLHYDFRNPPRWREPVAQRYAALLEQIGWAERELGYDSISISEHHGVDFASSPLTLAAAVAARTRRATIGTNVMVLPVHHPLRLAEDGLTLDALSGGRFRLGVGLGYREAELRAFGTSLAGRRSRAEEALVILRRAFDGERFAFSGRHWRFDEFEVTPGPVRPGGPELWIGGLSEPGIDRAARLGDGYLCPSVAAIAPYLEARSRHGKDAGRISLLQSWIVDEDPERTFSAVGEHLIYHFEQYREFGMAGIPALEKPADLLAHGMVTLLDAEGAVAATLDAVRAGPVELVEFWAVTPGERVEHASARLQYFASRVIPRVRDALGTGEATPTGGGGRSG